MRALKIAALLLAIFLAAAAFVAFRAYRLVGEPYKGFPEPEMFVTFEIHGYSLTVANP